MHKRKDSENILHDNKTHADNEKRKNTHSKNTREDERMKKKKLLSVTERYDPLFSCHQSRLVARIIRYRPRLASRVTASDTGSDVSPSPLP